MKKPILDKNGKIVELEESSHATLIEVFGYSAIPEPVKKQPIVTKQSKPKEEDKKEE